MLFASTGVHKFKADADNRWYLEYWLHVGICQISEL